MRSPDLTDAEEARAAELEAAIVAEEQAAEATKRRNRFLRSSAEESARTPSNLSLSAAEEYQYVARDVRRIATVGGTLVIILFALWAASHILGMGPL